MFSIKSPNVKSDVCIIIAVTEEKEKRYLDENLLQSIV